MLSYKSSGRLLVKTAGTTCSVLRALLVDCMTIRNGSFLRGVFLCKIENIKTTNPTIKYLNLLLANNTNEITMSV